MILIRHTKPRIAPGTCYGRTDLDVAESFEIEANLVVEALPPVSRVITSPLKRCRRLAEFIAFESRLPIEIEPRLQEMDFGRWEGVPWDHVPRDELDAWAADFLHACPHGGESVAQLRQRTRQALTDWRMETQTTLCVTHAGVIRAALSTGDRASDFGTKIDFGGMIQAPSNIGNAP